MKYSTYSQAKKDILLLNNFITLVDNYEVVNVDSFIIKSYAETSSIPKVIRALNETEYILDLPGNISNHSYISKILKQNPEDPLHQIVYNIYRNKGKRKR